MSVSEHVCDGVSLVENKCPGTNAQTLRCSVVTSAPQKTRHSERSISSRTQAINLRSANLTASLTGYTGTRVRPRKPSVTWRRPSESHQLPIGLPLRMSPHRFPTATFLTASLFRIPFLADGVPPVLIVSTSCTLASFYACRPTTRPSTLLSPVMYFSRSCASLGLHVTLGALESNYCIC